MITVHLSGHAIDRASQRFLNKWLGTRRPAEGLHTWLLRHAEEALRREPDYENQVHYRGIVFVFEYAPDTGTLPVLKTVRPKMPSDEMDSPLRKGATP